MTWVPCKASAARDVMQGLELRITEKENRLVQYLHNSIIPQATGRKYYESGEFQRTY